MTKKKIYVRDSSEFILNTTTLGKIYESGSQGVESKAATIDRATGFLQRLAQKTEWQLNDYAKCKEYLVSIIKGSNLLDSFVTVPASLLLSTVEDRISTTTGEVNEAWVEVGEFLKGRANKGVQHFIIDGQNRLFESIIPFFDNKIRLPASQSIVFVMSDENGDVEDPNIVDTFNIQLNDVVIDKVKQSKYKPALQNGVPVKVRYHLPIVFK